MELYAASSPDIACCKMPTIERLARWVRHTLGDDFPPDTNGIWQAGDHRPIHCLGIALAGSQEVALQAQYMNLDALLLGELPQNIGVLAVHEGLAQRLTIGENPWLAQQLGFILGKGLDQRRGRPVVLLAHTHQPPTVGEVLTRLGQDCPDIKIRHPLSQSQVLPAIALANAMQPKLVIEAAEHGAVLYLTGALRTAAHTALLQTKMAAIGLGHQAIEQWGLHWLCRAIQATFRLELVWLGESLLVHK